MLNPRSPTTYYRRHQPRTFLLVGLVALVTVGLYLMVALSWAIFIEPIRSNGMFLSKLSFVSPGGYRNGPDPTLASQLRANPHVERVIPAYGIQIALPQLMGGEDNWFFLFGLEDSDIPYLMERYGAVLKKGKIPEPRTNGTLLSEQVAANLDLQIGDTIHNSINPERFGNIISPLEVVGILESDTRLVIVSSEYLSSHEAYQNFPIVFLVAAHNGWEVAVDNFLLAEFQPRQAIVLTYQKLAEQMNRQYRSSCLFLIPIIIAVSLAVTFVVGALNQIEFARRLPEFGLLLSIGYKKLWLVGRLTMETTVLACVGWVTGILFSWLVLFVLKLAVFAPAGYTLTIISPFPVLLVIPVPLIITGITLVGFHRVFSRLDPIAVVERGELSLNESQPRAGKLSRPKGFMKPLAPLTYFRRHKQQTWLLTIAITMMIVAVVVVIFLLSATQNAQQVSLAYLTRMSRVSSPPGSSLHPSIITQLKTHSTVERVIPSAPRYFMLSLSIPGGDEANASPFAVYADDTAYLVELFGLELMEGHLPHPHSNEMVIPEIAAQNRGLKIGDVVGNPDNPAYPDAPELPVEFVISGIFAKATRTSQENLLGFISLEFLESNTAYKIPPGMPVIVAPKPGQKTAMDDWLENELAKEDVLIYTHRQQITQAKEKTRNLLMTITLLESGIALIAAMALAVLVYFSALQRQAEFGIMYALGFSRKQLVWRTVQEAFFITLTAWMISAVFCMGGMFYLKYGLFLPLGLQLNLLDLTPWFFTVPIPLVIVLVITGTISQMLRKLDPVSIVERR